MNWLRRKTINFVVKHLFRGITEEDVLSSDGKGGIMYKGQTLDKQSKEMIASQASQIDDMFLWRILQDEIRYQSYKQSFKKSESSEQMIFGKAMIHNLALLDKKIKNLKNIK